MILALGDCNIVGANSYAGKNYIDIVAEHLQTKAKNCGITMSTTREGVILFHECSSYNTSLVIVAYGLVDSWRTFKYAPYVLYYPDNFLRKFARKVVKKYKKLARSLGLNEKLGQKFVVPPQEYMQNLSFIAAKSKRVLFIETPPHLTETFRNPDIKYYNQLMAKVAAQYPHADVVRIYEDFAKDSSLYLDEIHFNQKGYELVAHKILEQL
ncbi:hypothetical protein NitYY0826_C1600 [Nitratiruptor sp. YY08-26]|nr:hypothetical protein NitYY0813_C1598 [Nitratiruptor sp. YY08-13]BCD66653.1 hypothetical protein NitYY0826_C1600 [Nitratiruptor sp. YY08-26]